jgi:hypothetical protein
MAFVEPRIYEEIVEFIASGATPQRVVDFRPSDALKQRVHELIEREKMEALSPDEQTELDHYMYLEHIMRLAKARAREYLNHAPGK